MNPPRPWRPGALLWASAGVHTLALGTVIAAPATWPWALAALVANHALVTATGLWPRSTALGPNWRRLPERAGREGRVAITIDDGPDPAVTPAVLDLLAAHGARATFFCIGERARAHPALVARMVAEGHGVENHSQHHRHHFALMGPARMGREIAAAQHTLGELTGTSPRFFRAPAGLRNPFLEPLLARQGLTLASWTRRGFDTRCGDPAQVLSRLADGLTGGDILLLHDGHGATGPDGQPIILAVLPQLLERCRHEGLTPVPLAEAAP